MTQYIGTKIIKAMSMNAEKASEVLSRSIPPEEGEGYLVEYEDGYRSWSPKSAFENAYRPCDNMNFGLAIEAMRKGSKVARIEWFGKDMFIYLAYSDNHDPREFAVAVKAIEDHVNPILTNFIIMKTTDNKFVSWSASQQDMLSDDWFIIIL